MKVARTERRDSRDSDPPMKASPRVVVVTGERGEGERLRGQLDGRGYDVLVVEDWDGFDPVVRSGVDLVVLGYGQSHRAAIEACRKIKAGTRGDELSVLMIASALDFETRRLGFEAGVDDILARPFAHEELATRVSTMLRISNLREHLSKTKRKLERLSAYDELTGLYNSRQLHLRLREEFKRAERYHERLSCVVVDVDRFGEHGRLVGSDFDEPIVRGVADCIRRCVREVDIVARYGAEEFLVILPATHLSGSIVVAQRIVSAVQERGFSTGMHASQLRVGASVGISVFPSLEIRSKDALLRAADAALKQAKREGGNRLCVFQREGVFYTPSSEDDARIDGSTLG